MSQACTPKETTSTCRALSSIFFFRCNCSTASVRGAAAAIGKAFRPIFPPTTAVAAPQAVSRDPFHFPPPQPCAPNPTAGRGEIHLAAGDGNVDRSGALRDLFASVAAGILAGIFTAPHSPRPSLLPSPHSSASRSPPSSTPLLVFVGPFKLATRTAAAAASKCFSVGFHVLYWRGVFFH